MVGMNAQVLAVRMPTIGAAFRVMREARGMTHDEVAAATRSADEKSTFGRSTVYAIEQRDDMPSHKTLMALASAYGLTLPALLIELAQYIEPSNAQVKEYSLDSLALAGVYERLNRQRREILQDSARSLLKTQEGDITQS